MQGQQHAFNTPLQLGPTMEDGTQFDQPTDADVYQLQLQAGDLVVLATDGILDNMCACLAACCMRGRLVSSALQMKAADSGQC